jgi:adenylate kinase family enzyme
MRVAVVGTSGSGKSTFARRLASALGAPVIELDAINWQPGWVSLSANDPAEFVRRVDAVIAGEAWVIDGAYSQVLRRILARATHAVWLDYSRPVVMRRVVGRSIARAWTGQELWPGSGNREDWRRWLDKDHPIRWAWDTHAPRRARYEAMFAEPGLALLDLRRLTRPSQAGPLIAGLASDG